MKKTYKEKYLELKKEKEYLQLVLDCRTSLYDNLKDEFNSFKSDLKIREERAEKHSLIVFLISISVIAVFGVLSVILGSLGLI